MNLLTRLPAFAPIGPLLPELTPIAQALRLEWPAPGEVRMRKIISRAAVRPTIKVPVLRLPRPVHAESELESDFFEIIDACFAVNAYGEQPCALHYETMGYRHRHVPDARVEWGNDRRIVEIKYSNTITDEDRERTRTLRRALPALGYSYHLLTEREIHRECYLENTQWLLRRGRHSVPGRRRIELFHAIRAAEALPLGCFDARDEALVARMILFGLLAIPMDMPIYGGTPVRVASEGGQPWAWALFN